MSGNEVVISGRPQVSDNSEVFDIAVLLATQNFVLSAKIVTLYRNKNITLDVANINARIFYL